jgi:hypothetical protein
METISHFHDLPHICESVFLVSTETSGERELKEGLLNRGITIAHK